MGNSFSILSDLTGGNVYTEVRGVSSTGVAVGSSNQYGVNTNGDVAIAMRIGDGVSIALPEAIDFNPPPQTNVFVTASGISHDGQFIVGRQYDGNDGPRQAVIWHGENWQEQTVLGHLPGFDYMSAGVGISDEGRRVAGFSLDLNFGTGVPWLWDSESGWLQLPLEGEGILNAFPGFRPMSGDGSIIVGDVTEYDAETFEFVHAHGFLWREGIGNTLIEPAPGDLSSSLNSVTRNGQWMAGVSTGVVDDFAITRAFRLSDSLGMELVPLPAGFDSVYGDTPFLTPDGNLLFGLAWRHADGELFAFGYDFANGNLFTVDAFLALNGIDTGGISDVYIRDIASDGESLTIGGKGTDSEGNGVGWIAQIDGEILVPVPEPAATTLLSGLSFILMCLYIKRIRK